MKKKILYIILILSIFSANSYANDELVINNDNLKTIKELKYNIDRLDEDRRNLFSKKIDLNSSNELISFFRTDLWEQDLSILKNIIWEYNKNKVVLEQKLNRLTIEMQSTTDIKKELLEVKKNLYKQMTPFINVWNYNAYLSYIKNDTDFYSQRTEIYSEILKKQEIVNTKIWTIEDRIREHRNNLESSLHQIISQKVQEKVTNIENNISFKSLEDTKKIEILDKTISRLNTDIKESVDNSSKKLEIYKITIEKLEDLKNKFKKDEN